MIDFLFVFNITMIWLMVDLSIVSVTRYAWSSGTKLRL